MKRCSLLRSVRLCVNVALRRAVGTPFAATVDHGGAGRSLRATEPRLKSTPEFVLEATETHHLAYTTIGVGKELLEQVREVGHRIEEWMRRATAEDRVGANR